MPARLFRIFSIAVFILASWMTIDNVWSDIEPIQALAVDKACTFKDCKKQHGVTRVERTPLGQSFEVSFADGPVNVSCRRESYVFGPRRCDKS
jgi:hypothetical protein